MKVHRAVLVLVAALAMMGIWSGGASATLGYCGPPVNSKLESIGWYVTNPTAAKEAERYVRERAAYYHINADQSFINWLQQKNVKYFPAPAGYKLKTNTACKVDGTIVPFSGKLDVGGINLLWYCADPKGKGSNCSPITKGYCRNWVTGKPIRVKHPVHKAKPVKVKKVVVVQPAKCGSNVTVKNSPGTVINCGVIQQVCSTTGGVKPTANCGTKVTVKPKAPVKKPTPKVKPAPTVQLVPVWVTKCTPNWNKPATFAVKFTVNGKPARIAQANNTCAAAQLISAPSGSRVCGTENFDPAHWYADPAYPVTQCSTVHTGLTTIFRYNNWRMAKINFYKLTVDAAGNNTTCSPNKSCSTAETFQFGLTGPSGQIKFQLPNDGNWHYQMGYVGYQYTTDELEGHGYNVSHYVWGTGPEVAGPSHTFVLTDAGIAIVFVNRRGVVPTTPTPTPTPVPQPTPAPKQAGVAPTQPALPGPAGVSPPPVDPGPGATQPGPAGGSAGSVGGGGSLPVPTPGVGGY